MFNVLQAVRANRLQAALHSSSLIAHV